MVALFAVLAWAVIRPRGWPEAVAAVPAAVIVVAVGAIPARTALTQARSLGPVIGFLAAILVLAHLCDDGAVLAVLLGVNIGPNTPPARSWWSGRSRRPASALFPRRRVTARAEDSSTSG